MHKWQTIKRCAGDAERPGQAQVIYLCLGRVRTPTECLLRHRRQDWNLVGVGTRSSRGHLRGRPSSPCFSFRRRRGQLSRLFQRETPTGGAGEGRRRAAVIGGPPPTHFPKRKVSCPAPTGSCPSRCRVLVNPLIVDVDWHNPFPTFAQTSTQVRKDTFAPTITPSHHHVTHHGRAKDSSQLPGAEPGPGLL